MSQDVPISHRTTADRSQRLLRLYQARSSQAFPDSDDDAVDTAEHPSRVAAEAINNNDAVDPGTHIAHSDAETVRTRNRKSSAELSVEQSGFTSPGRVTKSPIEGKMNTPNETDSLSTPPPPPPQKQQQQQQPQHCRQQEEDGAEALDGQQDDYSPADWLSGRASTASSSSSRYPPRGGNSSSPPKHSHHSHSTAISISSIAGAVNITNSSSSSSSSSGFSKIIPLSPDKSTNADAKQHPVAAVKYIGDDENRRFSNIYRNESKTEYDKRIAEEAMRRGTSPSGASLLSPTQQQKQQQQYQKQREGGKKTSSDCSSNAESIGRASDCAHSADDTNSVVSCSPTGVLQSLPLKAVFPSGFPPNLQKQTSSSSYVSNSSTISSYDDGDGTRVSKIKIPAVFTISVEGNNGRWSVENHIPDPADSVIDPNEVIKSMEEEDDNLSSTSDDRSTRSREIAASFNNLFGMFRCFFSAPSGGNASSVGSGGGNIRRLDGSSSSIGGARRLAGSGGALRSNSTCGGGNHNNNNNSGNGGGVGNGSMHSGAGASGGIDAHSDDGSALMCGEYRTSDSELGLGQEFDHSFHFNNDAPLPSTSLNGKIAARSRHTDHSDVLYAGKLLVGIGHSGYDSEGSDSIGYNPTFPVQSIHSSSGQMQHSNSRSKNVSAVAPRRSLTDS